MRGTMKSRITVGHTGQTTTATALAQTLKQPMLAMVLRDGETYTELTGCTIVTMDITAMATDGVDPDAEVAQAVKRGYYSKYVKVLTSFT
jgi:hypothetical protein